MPAAHRPVRRVLAATSVAGLLVLTACGADDEGDAVVVPGSTDETTQATPTPTESPTADDTDDALAADLTITVEDGSGGSTTSTLTCEPAGGDVPDPQAACATLAETWPEGFAAVPKDVACTQIYGGPETATVTGTVAGEQVLAEFNRTNGCEIDRWDALAPLLGQLGGPDS